MLREDLSLPRHPVAVLRISTIVCASQENNSHPAPKPFDTRLYTLPSCLQQLLRLIPHYAAQTLTGRVSLSGKYSFSIVVFIVIVVITTSSSTTLSLLPTTTTPTIHSLQSNLPTYLLLLLLPLLLLILFLIPSSPSCCSLLDPFDALTLTPPPFPFPSPCSPPLRLSTSTQAERPLLLPSSTLPPPCP
ncbi:hypothetical protein M430DRAFT_176099 [Amorphotheca resinae ATCC 22711]|uniref:Uncharacterized protein n=1 Tax=Amorphotheca resinae ATCC 22711 TaxID=857342 RepID=A0A2T3ASV6_AMORE|nr:hypothetical protein M430DRAFT_176099 [Amorphotheca resinae ATCC 22711]PSS10565.1 hypothetical protein M430DRAFT_176099 [Amorphotheca resinae ATCC 22711]